MKNQLVSNSIYDTTGSSLKNISSVKGINDVEKKYRWKFTLSRVTAGILEPFTQVERILWHKRIRDHRLPNLIYSFNLFQLKIHRRFYKNDCIKNYFGT